ncbi:MAG: MBL fold metallo-hydrolase [Bacillota bacterium]|jgi:cyclase
MKDLFVFTGASGHVNATIVPLKTGQVIVVDTSGTEADGKAFAEKAKQNRILFVFNTHEHSDHLAGNACYDVPIISSSAARAAILQDEQKAAGDRGVPNVHFGDKLGIYAGEEILFQQMGGHCPGSAVLYFPERRLLFTGDLIFNGRVPWMGQADFQRWIDNLAELESWDLETVVPGHGPVGGKEILRAQREWLSTFVKEVVTWHKEGKSQEEIFQAMAEKHPVAPGWHGMLRTAIRRAIEQY